MKTTITLFLISLTFYCYGQTYNLKDFVETPAPKPWSDTEWYNLNRSKDLKVAIVNGKLTITDFVYQQNIEYKLPFGILWPLNAGEFGGVLYYQPNDTTQKAININGKIQRMKDESRGFYKHFAREESLKSKFDFKQFEIYQGNVDGFFKFRDSLYFIAGLAHMGINEGSIYKIDMKKDEVSITKVMSFDDAPQSIIIKGNTIYLATFGRFYVLNNWKKETELDNLFWQALYPNSLTIKDASTLYAGLRGGYAKIDLKTKQVTLYKYNPAH